MRLIHAEVVERLGHIRHALFDFDGTLSVLREGWEGVMIPFMLTSLWGAGQAPPEVEAEVREYVDRSTGILTIKQMQWLAEAVRRYGRQAQVKTAAEYKAHYVRAILEIVRQRQARLAQGAVTPDEMTVAGSRPFLAALARQGVELYLASGTDHEYVLDEAGWVGLAPFFGSRIYGALELSEENDKELVIRNILAENHLAGEELLVVGDGPVELRIAKETGAIALGVASDEVRRSGWNERKIRRLVDAGADLLIPDFLDWAEVMRFLFPYFEM